MKINSRITSFLLIMVFLMQVFYVKAPVKALAVSKELKVSSALTQWVLDEPTNTLYAISETGRNLFIINSDTMTVEKSLDFNGAPTDIIEDNGKLYIALNHIHKIVVVDVNSRTIIETLNTSSDPYRLVKDGDKIYYSELDQWCDIYEYNLTTKTDKVISIGKYKPDIAINQSSHILYIGESSLSGSHMTYYSTFDNKVIDSTNYDNGYGFPYPSRDTLFDGSNVFYAGRDFSMDNAKRYSGDFGNKENVIFAKNGLVYTSKSIYDKETHLKLGDYGIDVTLVEASNNAVFTYNRENGSVKKFSDSTKTVSSSNVIPLISGNTSLPIQNSVPSVKINSGMRTLEMKSKLIQWSLDESTNTLYGISKEDKALFFIDATTLDLKKSLTFASSPTDIIEDKGNLYVALDDAYQIAVVDMASRTVTGRLYTSSDPYRLVKDGNKIYYAERDQWCDVYEYNLTTNTDEKLSIGTVYNPDLAINTDDHILYIGESGSSGSNMIYYSTADDKVIGKSTYNNGYGFPYPGRTILFDGKKVYYAGFDFDKMNPSNILGSYDEEIVFAKYGLAFSETSIYDSASYTLLQNPGDVIDLYEISEQGATYYYSEAENSILRIDLSKLVLVDFNSQGGSEVEYILADIDNVIKAPAAPKKAGYRFAGWYKEAETINPWNFAVDKVTDHTTLYAKWTIGNYVVKFTSNGGTAIQDQSVASTNKVVKPKDPTKGGYKFGGWYTDQYPFTKVFDFNNTILDSDVSLYARWIPTEAYVISYLKQTKDTKLFGIYNQAKAVILESDLTETKKGTYLGELAKYDSVVFTDINKYFINRCIDIASNPNLTDFLALIDEIDAKLNNDIDRGYFKGQMDSWGRYRVYTPEVQASITAIGQVWTLKTPEAISEARDAIAAVKESGSVKWLNFRLDEAIQAISK